MTITITNPGWPYPIGQGQQLAAQTDLVGPIADDDYWLFWIEHNASGRDLSQSLKRAHGARLVNVFFGYEHDYPGEQPFAPSGGAAFGDAVTVHITLYHSNLFTVVDSGTFTGGTYDPYTGLSNLILRAPSQSVDIQAILNAVVRTFPAP
jgi:hypothetical protein